MHEDLVPRVPSFSGEPDTVPFLEFMEQFDTWAQVGAVPQSELVCQLARKLQGRAHSWFIRQYDPSSLPSYAQLSEDLHAAFGQDFEAATLYRLRETFVATPGTNGPTRLRELQAVEHAAARGGIPTDAGPNELAFYRRVALFPPGGSALSMFLSELSGNPMLSDVALRALSTTGPRISCRLTPTVTNPAREAFFLHRIRAVEAALSRLPTTAARQEPVRPTAARALQASAAAVNLAAPTPAAEPQVRRERSPPPYFGANTTEATRTRNRQEFLRRRTHQWCFLCRPTDLQEVPYWECPVHGRVALNNAPGRAENPS